MSTPEKRKSHLESLLRDGVPSLKTFWKITDNAEFDKETTYVEGTYEQACRFALTLENFIGPYGARGTVVAIDVHRLSDASVKQREEDLIRLEEIEDEKEKLEERLK